MGLVKNTPALLPIGMDVGYTNVRLVQLRMSQTGPELLGAASVHLPTEYREDEFGRLDYLSENIRKIMKSRIFKGNQCVLSLPAEVTFVHHVRIPQLPQEKMEQALREEVADKLPYPIENAVLRHIVAGEVHAKGRDKQEVIIIAVTKDTLKAYMDMAHRAKLDLEAVNIEPCAIVECFARLFTHPSDVSHSTLFVDIGTASTQAVFAHGGNIVFAHNLAGGARQFNQAVAEKLGVPVTEAHAIRQDMVDGRDVNIPGDELYAILEGPLAKLTEELTQCLRYYESVFRNQAVSRVIFVGGQAYDKRLCQTIARRLNLPAQIGDPLLQVRRVEGIPRETCLNRHEPCPDWTVAVGLSLGGELAA